MTWALVEAAIKKATPETGDQPGYTTISDSDFNAIKIALKNLYDRSPVEFRPLLESAITGGFLTFGTE